MSMNWDPTGKLILELRADGDVAAITGTNPTSSPVRVRGGEPAPEDVQPKGSYRAFVVLVNLGGVRWKRVPVQRPRYVARCYGRTMIEASALAVAVSDAMHYAGARVHLSNGLGIYASWDDTSGEMDRDPDTGQPMVPVFLDVIATTMAVA